MSLLVVLGWSHHPLAVDGELLVADSHGDPLPEGGGGVTLGQPGKNNNQSVFFDIFYA